MVSRTTRDPSSASYLQDCQSSIQVHTELQSVPAKQPHDGVQVGDLNKSAKHKLALANRFPGDRVSTTSETKSTLAARMKMIYTYILISVCHLQGQYNMEPNPFGMLIRMMHWNSTALSKPRCAGCIVTCGASTTRKMQAKARFFSNTLPLSLSD